MALRVPPQGQRLRLPPCAEVVMLRALPQVAELLLPSPSEERWAETEGVWLEPGRLYKQHLDFFTKIDSEPDQAGIEFGKKIRSPMRVGAG